MLENKTSFSNQDKAEEGPRDSGFINAETATRATRGKICLVRGDFDICI